VRGEEGPELVGPMGQRKEHVRDEPRLLLNGLDQSPDVVGKVGEFRNREAGDRTFGHRAIVAAARESARQSATAQ